MSNNQTFPIWTGKAPHALGDAPGDVPTITLFPPSVPANGAAMLVYPGGGFEALMDYEGEAYAHWLAGQGYYAFVVAYRLTPHGYALPEIFQDCMRSVRWARARAGQLGYDPLKIGVIGSSAGAHLCANLSVHWDLGDSKAEDPVERVSSRPDLAVLCYSPINLPRPFRWLRLFGGQVPEDKEINFYSAARNVHHDTPPAFLFHTAGDEMVPAEQSLIYARALARKKVPYEVHIYERGQHGLALGNGHPWTVECLRWLKERFSL
jgi:acetyl esterase/lipase